jgi:tRNA 2-thiouridine synthesizing protein A
MTVIRLDLRQLKCPLPVLRTRKALRTLRAGDMLEVHCTDPLAVIDLPALIQQTGDRIELLSSDTSGAVFLIEKAG